MQAEQATYGIVGLGLIGGSLAKDLRHLGLADRIIGHDASEIHQARASALGIVQGTGSLEEVIESARVLILAVPVDALESVLPVVLDRVSRDHIVIEVGSAKERLLSSLQDHPNREKLVSAHPMAGTENTGPDAAVYHLFDQKCCVLCDTSRSDPDKTAFVRSLFEQLGMYVIRMNAREHDLHAAYVSHISHITSFALAQTVLEKERDEARIFEMASGGFSSTVRLAKSAPSMWTPIFLKNKENVLDVLQAHIDQLNYFRECLENDDNNALSEWMEQANQIRKIIK